MNHKSHMDKINTDLNYNDLMSSRQMTREQYKTLYSAYREGKNDGCLSFASMYFAFRYKYDDAVQSHFWDVSRHHRWLREQPRYQYLAASEAWAERQAEWLGDEGESAYVTALENAASRYHLYGNGEAWIVS